MTLDNLGTFHDNMIVFGNFNAELNETDIRNSFKLYNLKNLIKEKDIIKHRKPFLYWPRPYKLLCKVFKTLVFMKQVCQTFVKWLF